MAAINQSSDLRLQLHPKQSQAFLTKATEVLYGGAAGGGKSHVNRVSAIAWCVAIPNLQVYIFRRQREDLIKPYMEGPTGFRTMLAQWVLEKRVDIVEDEIRFKNGSRIYLCHCKDPNDVLKYLTAEIHVLIIDELTQFLDDMYRFLRSRVRMPKVMQITLPESYKNSFPRILCSSNPGGIGHQFVKMTWIDNAEPMSLRLMPPDEGGFTRQYIPAKLADNPSLDYESYKNNLSGLGNPELVRAMLDGDWDVVAGAALVITREQHMLRPFTPPRHWTKFMCIDWGFVRPFSVGWFCVAEGGTVLTAKGDWDERIIPDGALILYRELYGWTGKPNEGSRQEAPQVAREIMRIEKDADERMDYRIGDTGMWAKVDGPSVMERMHEEGVTLGQSEKDRAANYMEVCNRLKGNEIEKDIFEPMFYATSNCHSFWRTMPSLVLDDKQPEKGPDSDQEDHTYDMVGYACMSRPFVLTKADRQHALFHKLRRENKLDSTDPYAIRKRQDKRYAGKKR